MKFLSFARCIRQGSVEAPQVMTENGHANIGDRGTKMAEANHVCNPGSGSTKKLTSFAALCGQTTL